MARLKKKFFGNLSGAFGDAVFRQLGDNNYIAQRPSGYKTPDTQEFRDRTSKFGLSVKLAKSIYRIPALKTFWAKEFPNETRLFNFLVRTNYPFINPDGISSTPYLAPDENSFSVPVNTISISGDAVNVVINALDNTAVIDPVIEKKIRLISVVLLANPLDQRMPAFRVLTMQSEDLTLSVTDPITFNIVPSQNYSERIQNYGQKKAFFVLVTLDNNDDLVNYSSTFYGS